MPKTPMPIWTIIRLTNGQMFIAKSVKEDALTVAVSDVIRPLWDDLNGYYRIEVLSKQRYINRGVILYRDVVDEAIDLNATYTDVSDMPVCLQRIFYTDEG